MLLHLYLMASARIWFIQISVSDFSKMVYSFKSGWCYCKQATATAVESRLDISRFMRWMRSALNVVVIFIIHCFNCVFHFIIFPHCTVFPSWPRTRTPPSCTKFKWKSAFPFPVAVCQPTSPIIHFISSPETLFVFFSLRRYFLLFFFRAIFMTHDRKNIGYVFKKNKYQLLCLNILFYAMYFISV